MPQASFLSGGAVAFRLVGLPRYKIGSNDWKDLHNKGAAQVLAYVGLHGASPRDVVARTFWGSDTGRHNLRECVHKLHRQLRAEGFTQQTLVAGKDLISLGDGISVDTAEGFSDAAKRLELRDLLLGTQIDRLPDEGKLWFESQRASWHRARARAFEHAAAALRAKGKASEAADLLQQVIEVDVRNGRLVHQLGELRSQLGDPDAALQLIERYLRAQRDDTVDVAPDHRLTALAKRLQAERRAPRTLRPIPAAVEADALFGTRRDVLSKIGRAWDAEQAFILFGEAGSGKTMILSRCCSEDRPGLVFVAAQEGDDRVAFGTARRWLQELIRRWRLNVDEIHWRELRRLMPELGSPPPSPGVKGALEAAQDAAMTHAHRLGLSALVVDDLHFADSASLALLRRCCEVNPGIRFGFGARPARDAPAESPIRLFVQRCAGLVSVALPALSLADVQEFLRRDPCDLAPLGYRAAELLRVSAGNPWRLVDLLRRHFERGEVAVPFAKLSAGHSREDVVLPRLTWPAQSVLNLAAIAGADFSFDLVAVALELGADELDKVRIELSNARLIYTGALAHEMVRYHVRSRIDDATARHLHALTAAALSNRDSPAERLAHHFGLAEDWGHAARQAERAATGSERAGQRERQYDWLRSAERWYRQAGQEADAWRVGVLALEPCLLLRGSDAALADADRLAESATCPAELAAVDVERARISLIRSDPDAAMRFALAARDADGASADTVALAVAAVVVVQAWRGEIPEALTTIEPMISRVADFVSARTRQELWTAYGMALSNDERWRQVVTRWPQAVRDAQRLGDRSYELDALNSLAAGYCGLGRIEQGIDLLRQAIRLGSEIDDNPHSNRIVHMNLAANLVSIGHYREAIDILQGVIVAAETAGDDANTYRSTAEDVLAEAWLALGRPDLATRQVSSEPPSGNAGRRLARALLRARAATQLDAGDADRLWHQALQAARAVAGAPIRRTRALLIACRALSPEEGLGLCTSAVALAREHDQPVLEMLALSRRARLLLNSVSPQQARPDVVRVLELAESTQSIHVNRPELWWTAAEVLLATRDTDLALWCLKTARAWLQRVADEHVPPGLRDDFLERHPVHRRLLSRAADGPCDSQREG